MAAKKKTTSKKKAAAKKTAPKKRAAPKRRTTVSKAKPKKAPAAAPKAGTTLTRRHKGKDHVVKTTADGFEYAGTTYRSLTQVAKILTGYASISGPRFFGTDAASQKKGGAK